MFITFTCKANFTSIRESVHTSRAKSILILIFAVVYFFRFLWDVFDPTVSGSTRQCVREGLARPPLRTVTTVPILV